MSQTFTQDHDMTRDGNAALRFVKGLKLLPGDKERAAAERARNPLLHITHHAYKCRNAEETRRFYEDILGMPLVFTIVMEDPFRSDGALYCHFFFEMADGNCLAFFDHTDEFKPADFEPQSGWQHHLAMEVAEDDTVQVFRQRLEDAGIKNMYIDHGQYRSLLFNDPNGLNLEITFKAPGTVEFEILSRQVAHHALNEWATLRDQLLASRQQAKASSAVATK